MVPAWARPRFEGGRAHCALGGRVVVEATNAGDTIGWLPFWANRMPDGYPKSQIHKAVQTTTMARFAYVSSSGRINHHPAGVSAATAQNPHEG
jgi:hypothetical protein